MMHREGKEIRIDAIKTLSIQIVKLYVLERRSWLTLSFFMIITSESCELWLELLSIEQ